MAPLLEVEEVEPLRLEQALPQSALFGLLAQALAL